MYEAIVTSWPSDLCTDEAKSISLLSSSSSLRDLAIAVRVGLDPVRLQAALLAKYSSEEDKESCEILLCWLAINQLDQRSFGIILEGLRKKNPARFEVRLLTLYGWLWKNDLNSIAKAPSSLWEGQDKSPLLQLCKAKFFIKTGELSKAKDLLSLFSNCVCPEMAMIQASLFSKRGNEAEAIDLLLSNLHRCPNHVRYYKQLLLHMIEGKDSNNVMPCARKALATFGEHSEILYHLTALNLYKRQPGLARRSALLQQVSATVRPTSINLGNQLAAYEMNGQSDWLQFLDPVISSEGFSAEPQLQANLVMQLASIQSDKYPSYLQSLVTSLEAKPSFHDLSRTARDLLGSRKLGVQGLKIGWITADSHYHPVARFLYGMLAPQKINLIISIICLA